MGSTHTGLGIKTADCSTLSIGRDITNSVVNVGITLFPCTNTVRYREFIVTYTGGTVDGWNPVYPGISSASGNDITTGVHVSVGISNLARVDFFR